MSNNLYDTIRQIIRQELRQVRSAELGIVQEQHPHASDSDSDNYACTVVLRDSEIVLPRVPVATGRIGAATIPNVGELVLVQFVSGNINKPVIIGRFYNDEDRPPVNEDGQLVYHLPEVGGGVQLLVNGHESTLELQMGSGVTVTLQDADPAVLIDVGGGSATLQIDSDGTVMLTSQRALTLEAATDMTLKALNITAEASAQLTLKGALVQIN